MLRNFARKEFLIVALGNLGVLLGTFIALKIVATSISLEEFGLYGLAVAFAGGVSRVVFAPLSQTVLRFSADATRLGLSATLNGFTSRVFRIGVVMSLAAALTILAAVPEMNMSLAVVSFALSIALGASVVISSHLAALRERKAVAAGQVITALGRGLLVLPVVAVSGLQAVGALLAYLLSVTLVSIAQYGKLKMLSTKLERDISVNAEDTERSKKAMRRRFSPYFGSVAAIVALDALLYDLDKVAFSYLLTVEQIGLLVGVQQIAKAAPLLVAGLTEQYLLPIQFAENVDKKNDPKPNKTKKIAISFFMLAIVPLGGLAIIFSWSAEVLVKILLSEAFVPAAALLPWLTAGYALSFCGRLLHLPGLQSFRTGSLVAVKVIQTTAFFVFAFWLYQSHGLIGIGYAFCLSSLVFVLGLMASYLFQTKENAN